MEALEGYEILTMLLSKALKTNNFSRKSFRKVFASVIRNKYKMLEITIHTYIKCYNN